MHSQQTRAHVCAHRTALGALVARSLRAARTAATRAVAARAFAAATTVATALAALVQGLADLHGGVTQDLDLGMQVSNILCRGGGAHVTKCLCHIIHDRRRQLVLEGILL